MASISCGRLNLRGQNGQKGSIILRQPERCEKIEIGEYVGCHHETATNLANVVVWTVGNWSRTLSIEKTMEVSGCPECGLFEM